MFRKRTLTVTDGESVEEAVTGGLAAVRDRAAEAANVVAPKVEAAREAVAPKIEAAREAVGPKIEQVRGKLQPRVESAVSTLTPSVGALRRERPSRWPSFLAALGVGALAGAITALLTRRMWATPGGWTPPAPTEAPAPVQAAPGSLDPSPQPTAVEPEPAVSPISNVPITAAVQQSVPSWEDTPLDAEGDASAAAAAAAEPPALADPAPEPPVTLQEEPAALAEAPRDSSQATDAALDEAAGVAPDAAAEPKRTTERKATTAKATQSRARPSPRPRPRKDGPKS